MRYSRPDAGHNDEGMQRETLDLLLIRLWLKQYFRVDLLCNFLTL